MHKNQFGFSLIEIFVDFLVLTVVGFVGYYVWLSSYQKKTVTTITPTKQVAETDYLILKEWHAKIPLTKDIKDANYIYNASNDTVTISTSVADTLLKTVKGCKSGLTPPTLERLKPGRRYVESAAIFNPDTDKLPHYKLGDYYVQKVTYAISTCAVESNQTAQMIFSILNNISGQIPSIRSID